MTTPIPTRWLGKLGSGLLLTGLLLAARPGQAQTADTYAFAPSTGTFTALPATAINVASVQADDALSASIPLGFSFTFDGTAYTTCKVSSNGWLTFNDNATANSLANNLATGTAAERPRVAPFWDDLNGSSGTASYQTTGTAPNRTFTFEWKNWIRFGNTGGPSFSMQVQLVEGTNVVRFVYTQLAGAPISNASASIGLSGAGSGPCSFLSLSDASASPTVSSATETATIAALPATGQIYSFTPAAPGACPTPRCLAASTVTATTATVTYSVSNTTPGPFTIVYGLPGFNPALPASATNVYSTTTATGTTATLTGLTANTTYQFYVVQNCGGTSGSSPRSSVGTFTTNPNPAANDECATAVSLPVTTSCTTPLTGSVFGATQSLAPATNCGGTVANDVWYSFVATSTAMQLTTGAQFTGFYDVRSGACASTTSLTCGSLGSTAAPSTILVSGLVSGQTYYLRVYSSATTPPAAAASSFTLCLSLPTSYCNTNLGGACGSSEISAVSIAGTTLNATGLTCTTTNGQAYTAYPATGANTATLQSGVPYQLSVTVGTGSIASVWIDYNRNLVFEASEWTQLTTNSTTAPAVVTINLPTNAVQGPTGLRIRTRSAGSANGATDACTQFFSGETKDFTVTIGPPTACPTASNVAVTAITSTTATLTFTTAAAATSYTLTLTPQSGTATTQTVTTPASLTGLQPNTTYTASLVSNCAGSTTSAAAVFTFTTLPTPPANNECTTAATLTVSTTCTSPTSGTVYGATQSLAPTTGCAGTAANDVWYSFVATNTSHAFTLAPQFAAVYDVRSGTCANSTSLFCASVAAAATGTNIVAGLTVGQTYFVRVYASGTQPSTTAASTFTLCIIPGPTAPANNECTTAATLTVSTSCTSPTSGTVYGASQSLAPTATCAGTVANDVWYSFVATSNSHTIALAPQFGAVYDVRTGTCASSTSLFCTSVASAATSNNTIGGLTVGQTYFVRVYASGTQPTTAATGAFTLCITPGPATPANDDCAGALNVPVQFGTCVTQVSADNTAATASTGVPAPTCASYQGRDLWFKVTVPASGSVTVSTVAPTGGSSVTDTGLSVYSGTCSTLTDIGCNDDTNGLYSQLVFTGRTPGEVLYIRVWSFGGNTTGPIAVCATAPSNCAAPTGPNASAVTDVSATLNWVAPSGSTTGITYEIEYGPQNFTQGTGTSLTGLTTTSRAITGLTPATAYCFYVRANCGAANGSSAWVGPTCFTTPLTVPTNDEPCGALTLGAGPRTGTTAGATTTVQSSIITPVCSPASQPKDVWFAFTPTGTSVTLTTTGAPAGMVRVYASPSCSAGPFTLVNCAASGANNTAITTPISLTGLTAGQRYYVAVSGYGSSDTGGQFTIAATGVVTAARAQAETDALLVYPNPSTTGQLTLKLSGLTGAAQASLLNALGQVVLTKNLTAATEQTLSTRGLATGVYTLRVQANGQLLTRKVVLE